MSYFCQFCDKEMMLTESVVHIKEYITCGRLPCVKKAKANDRYYAPTPEESDQILVSVVLFSTKTPEDYDSWLPLKPDKHPTFLKDQAVLSRLLNGDVVNLKDSEDCYRALPSNDLKKSDFPYAVQLLLDDMGIIEKDKLTNNVTKVDFKSKKKVIEQ